VVFTFAGSFLRYVPGYFEKLWTNEGVIDHDEIDDQAVEVPE